ncbi:hypothetical protein HMPREF9141_2628 [Prevotella multiformis DSM 16608]|uniref:Uncharacterized protein n=1 Tax=Prevotella multiformis DSM 16608 TaxID=888743 RepID=F0FAL1_9BACT|nr:hypothetical protein HMPREF9141_2628 [Prevotella multiformis DSM 16608]
MFHRHRLRKRRHPSGERFRNLDLSTHSTGKTASSPASPSFSNF